LRTVPIASKYESLFNHEIHEPIPGRNQDQHSNEEIAVATVTPALTNTGIGFIGDVPWGAHLCLFYETKEDLLDTVVAYLKAGLENKEFCVWAISEPLTEDVARSALSQAVPAFDQHWAAGSIDIVSGLEWYLERGRIDLQRIIGAWKEKLRDALARGYGGMRASGMAAWLGADHWKDFSNYEHELDRSLAGQPMTVLCTYPLAVSKPVDILDVVRAHRLTAARRRGDWDVIAAPQHWQANPRLGLRIAELTSRERQVLDLVVKGDSNKQIARILGIGQRTVETHRARLMKKIGARSIPELIRLAIIGSPDHNT
jgi:DNA-binding CsgD family transcriptional regulator